MRLKELRTSKALLQKDIALSINTGINTYASWEKGRTEPSVYFLSKLADYFGCSIDYLVGREDIDGSIIIKNNDLQQLTEKENYVLKSFRVLRETDQELVIGFLKRFLVSP